MKTAFELINEEFNKENLKGLFICFNRTEGAGSTFDEIEDNKFDNNDNDFNRVGSIRKVEVCGGVWNVFDCGELIKFSKNEIELMSAGDRPCEFTLTEKQINESVKTIIITANAEEWGNELCEVHQFNL